MLDGLCKIDFADDRGFRARGSVSLRNGRVCGDSDTAEIEGTYGERGDGTLAALGVVLNCKDRRSEPSGPPVGLRAQALAASVVISASGVDQSEAERHANIRLEQRDAIDRCQVRLRLTAPPLSDARTGQGRPLDAVKPLCSAMTRSSAGSRSRTGVLRADCCKAQLPSGALASTRKPRGSNARGPSLTDRRSPWPKVAPAPTATVVPPGREPI